MRISDELAKSIYDAKEMLSSVPDSLIRAYSARLLQAITEGLTTTDDEAADTQMLEALSRNVYQFSAAKSYNQMKSMTEALLDDQGKLRTWTQFRNAALEINNEQVMQWLQAEYQNAVACSQMASRWMDISSRKASLPMLRYVTAGDDRVRPAHRLMNGITLPVNHTFWHSYYPPNGWGCRCDVQQGNWAATGETEVYYPDEKEVPSLFRFNPGISKMVFPQSHPYFNGVPHDILKQGEDLFNEKDQ